jgi:hydroxyacylglutathione hydrolase
MLRTSAALVLVALAGCAPTLPPIHSPPASLAVTTTGPWRSMMYLGRTDAGIIVIDLGWLGAEGTLRRALDEIGAGPEDVSAVFLTHSHRDHVVGWRLIPDATFHMAAPEVVRFTGRARHRGLVPRLADWLLPTDLPEPGEVRVRGFSSDTTFVVGRDTVHAFEVPGHTAGSAAYLFRGVLFVGDALSWSRFGGLREDRRHHSDDSRLNRASVGALWDRIPAGRVEWVCTAHARCERWE